MKKILTLLFIGLIYCSTLSAQSCADVRARGFTGRLFQLDWSSETDRDATWDALLTTGTAISVTGFVNGTTAFNHDFTKAELQTFNPTNSMNFVIRTNDNLGTGSGNYDITVTLNYTGGGSDVCVYENSFPLVAMPIELTDFTARSEKKSVMLNWQTASELNNDYMLIERSTDGRNFKEIGNVKGAGTTQELQRYSLEDLNPIPGINYYRICQVDFDGTKSFSYTVGATVRNDIRKDLIISPTMVQNHSFITIDFLNMEPATSILEIINISGQVVATYQINLGNGRQEIPVADLANGAYLLRTSTSGQLMTGRFMKVR